MTSDCAIPALKRRAIFMESLRDGGLVLVWALRRNRKGERSAPVVSTLLVVVAATASLEH